MCSSDLMRAFQRGSMMPSLSGVCRLPAIGGLCLLLSSCGGSGDAAASPPASSPVLSGSLVDLSIAGLSYATSTISGTTSSGGGYTYRCAANCETLTFSLGPIVIGQATGTSTLSMKDFAGGMDGGVLSNVTVRRVQFLVAMDADADVSNGISIPSELAPSLAGRSLDFNSTSFDTELAALVDRLRGDSRLSSSYRSGMQVPTTQIARAIAEQTEALARGVLVETPTSALSPVRELRKYVLRVPDASLVPYSGRSSLLKSAYARGLRPALGAGLAVASGTIATGLQLRSVTTRGIAVAEIGRAHV